MPLAALRQYRERLGALHTLRRAPGDVLDAPGAGERRRAGRLARGCAPGAVGDIWKVGARVGVGGWQWCVDGGCGLDCRGLSHAVGAQFAAGRGGLKPLLELDC